MNTSSPEASFRVVSPGGDRVECEAAAADSVHSDGQGDAPSHRVKPNVSLRKSDSITRRLWSWQGLVRTLEDGTAAESESEEKESEWPIGQVTAMTQQQHDESIPSWQQAMSLCPLCCKTD